MVSPRYLFTTLCQVCLFCLFWLFFRLSFSFNNDRNGTHTITGAHHLFFFFLFPTEVTPNVFDNFSLPGLTKRDELSISVGDGYGVEGEEEKRGVLWAGHE